MNDNHDLRQPPAYEYVPSIATGGACETHHHACDCREVKFAELQAENDRLKDELDTANKDMFAWYAEAERLLAMAPVDVAGEGEGPMTIDDVIAQLKHHQWTHADWRTWFEEHPDDTRAETAGNAAFQANVERTYSRMIGSLEAARAELFKAREHLERLPLTADGVRVTPGMTLWAITGNKYTVEGVCQGGYWFSSYEGYRHLYREGKDYYSTEAAARAAREASK